MQHVCQLFTHNHGCNEVYVPVCEWEMRHTVNLEICSVFLGQCTVRGGGGGGGGGQLLCAYSAFDVP